MLHASEIGEFVIKELASKCWPTPKKPAWAAVPAWVALALEAGSAMLHASEIGGYVTELRRGGQYMLANPQGSRMGSSSRMGSIEMRSR